MWGNFLEKAKGLAENLDKQLNESVGIDADPTAPSVPLTSSASNLLGMTDKVASVDMDPILPPTVSNDTWNDHFDFDDEEEAPIPRQEEIPVELKKKIPNDSTEPVELPVSPPTQASTSDEKETVPPISVESSSTEPINRKEEDPTENGWDGGVDDLQMDFDEDDLGGENTPGTTSSPEIATTKPYEIPVTDADTGMNGTAIPSSTEVKDEESHHLIAETDDSVESATFQSYVEPEPTPPPITTKGEEVVVSSSTKPVPTFGSMFSSLANTAEAFAQQAESLVKIPTTQEKGIIGKTSIFSSFPLASSSSSSPGQIQPPVAATNSSKDDVDTTDFDASANGWVDESDDLDLVGTDAAEMDQTVNDSTEDPSEAIKDIPPPMDIQAPANQYVEPEAPMQSSPMPSSSSSPPPPAQVLDEPTSAPEVSKPVWDIETDPRYLQLLEQLRLRENQLSNKSNQLTELQLMMDQQETELKQKVIETKEEAKRRILSAKERCEAAEAKVQILQSSVATDSASQAQLIQALREEGAKLAQKQSAMEQAVRAAKVESRNFKEQLEIEQDAKDSGLEKISKLEQELKSTKESLVAARKGEAQANKLEQDLMTARSDAEMKASTILSLQQQVKELVAEGKEWQELLERARREAQKEVQHETKTLRREHNDVISDLETKLRSAEREAAVREDALRHEVSEIRKRWEDAVRRADGTYETRRRGAHVYVLVMDAFILTFGCPCNGILSCTIALSMDIQSSTAPLLRQLESMERQNRVRTSNWADLETRLRTELEESVIQNETLSKDRSEFKTKCSRLERLVSDHEQDLKQCKRTMEEQLTKISKLETQLEDMEIRAAKREEDYTKVERLANEGVMRVRSEMTQTVVDSEERYRSQITKLENELREHRDKKILLEKQVEQLLETSGMIMGTSRMANGTATDMIRRESKPKRLRQAEGQVQILAGALGLDDDSDTDGDDDSSDLGNPMDRGEGENHLAAAAGGGSSFAALDQLTSKLKANAVELDSLKRNLRESERVRESLVEELSESRIAKEKLPLFESKVKELTEENRELVLEIQGLRDDIADVREMYRTQLNILLEDKARQGAPTTDDHVPDPAVNDNPMESST